MEQLAVFDVEGENIELAVNQSDTLFILLSGEPIREEITQQGPFVMNTQTEILEAMRDYQMGKMGFLVEDDLDP
jgi:redox-sensitive bicupin YhaK (pirin superfamily)